MHSTGFAVVKTGLLDLYRFSTCIEVVKTGKTIFYRLSTIPPVVKMCLGNIYKASTGFVVVKTGLLNYSPSTRLTVDKTAFSTSMGLQQTSWQSKLCWQTSIVLQLALKLPNIYKPSTGFVVTKTCIMIHYRHWAGFAAVETGFLNIYSPSTGNAG